VQHAKPAPTSRFPRKCWSATCPKMPCADFPQGLSAFAKAQLRAYLWPARSGFAPHLQNNAHRGHDRHENACRHVSEEPLTPANLRNCHSPSTFNPDVQDVRVSVGTIRTTPTAISGHRAKLSTSVLKTTSNGPPKMRQCRHRREPYRQARCTARPVGTTWYPKERPTALPPANRPAGMRSPLSTQPTGYGLYKGQ
jgi:hypothetical protein